MLDERGVLLNAKELLFIGREYVDKLYDKWFDEEDLVVMVAKEYPNHIPPSLFYKNDHDITIFETAYRNIHNLLKESLTSLGMQNERMEFASIHNKYYLVLTFMD